MGTKKSKELVARQAVRHEEVTLITRSEEITEKPTNGKLTMSQQDVYVFEQDDTVSVHFGERKWKKIRVDADKHVYVTKNMETGFYRIAYKLGPTDIKAMNKRFMQELAEDLEEQLEKIYNINA